MLYSNYDLNYLHEEIQYPFSFYPISYIPMVSKILIYKIHSFEQFNSETDSTTTLIFYYSDLGNVATYVQKNYLSSIKTYPNPAKNFIHLEIEDMEIGTISIFNNLEKLIMLKAVDQNHQVDIQELKEGIYFFKYQSKLQQKTGSFIKVK